VDQLNKHSHIPNILVPILQSETKPTMPAFDLLQLNS